VFGLEPSTASAADVRRQYRRLATLLHPDKSQLPGAEAAFKQLQAAADRLASCVAEAEDGGPQGASTGRPSKRPKTSTGRGAAGGGAADAGTGWDESEDDAWFRGGGGFPWWEEWDAPVAAAAAGPQGQEGLSEAGKQEQPKSGARASPPDGEQPAGPASQAAQGQEDEQARLSSMSLEELRAEVRRRQEALLDHQLDEQGRPVPLSQLQAALKQARSVLAEKAAAVAAEQAVAADGGFVR
jgi:hypothetical protein